MSQTRGEMPKRQVQALVTVRRFMRAINAHHPDALAQMLATNHEFTDTLGNCVRGRDAMRLGWVSYFKLIPDYQIEVARTLSKANAVVLLGFASGTCAVRGKRAKTRWRIPAAWFAEVRGRRIARWQVYADNKPVYDILSGTGRRVPH